MPIYVVYAPDLPDILARRVEVRPRHLEAGARSRASGNTIFGRGTLNDTYSQHEASSPPAVPEGQLCPGIDGSLQVYRYPSLEAVWARVRADPYWIEGVWDRERVVVKELLGDAADATLKVVS